MSPKDDVGALDEELSVGADAPSEDVNIAGPAPKTWRIGTLVYTTGGLGALFGWLLWGDFSWQMRDRAVAPVAQLLLKQLHASNFVVGLLISSIPSALGLIIGPTFNTMSDRYRSRLGRRIPFLLFPTPFATLALVGLAFAPSLGRIAHGLPVFHAFAVHSVAIGVFALIWSIFEITAIMTNGIYNGLINDVVPHALIGRFYGLFRMISLFAGILFNYWLLKHAEQHYREILIGLAILYGAGLTLMCLRVKEGKYPPPEPMEKRGESHFFGPIRTYFRETFTHPYYVAIFIAAMLSLQASAPVNGFSLYYAKSIGLSLGAYGKYLALTYIISFSISFLLGWLADRFHPLRIVIVSVALYTLNGLWAGVYARTPETFGIAFVLHGVFSGCLFTSIVPTYQLLFPKARFGEFNSAAGLLMGLVSIILTPAVGLTLDHTGHIYRYTFLIGGWIGVCALFALGVVYKRFMALGGPKGYVAPH